MATIYEWIVPQDSLVTKPQEGDLTDVVVAVNWLRTGTVEVDGIVYTANTFGAYSCPTPSETDFTAYPDLTEDQVIGWLNAGITGEDLDKINAIIDKSLDYAINPPTIVLPNPWITTTTTTTTTEAPVTTSTTTTEETTLA
jgi:hypothetical protein